MIHHQLRMQQLGFSEHNEGVIKPKSRWASTRVPKFLRSLYNILQYEDQAILAWANDGTSFQIFDTKRLESAILPKYFNHGKFASFQRQLNNFGFRKWTKTQSSVCTFSHYHLIRCDPQHLAELINSRERIAPVVHSPTDACSLAGRKRTFMELVQSANGSTAIAKKSPKIKTESSSGALPPIIATNDRVTSTTVERAARWAMDPISFLETNDINTEFCATALSKQTLSFSVEELQDVILPDTERQDKQRIEKIPEMRMMTNCFKVDTENTIFNASFDGADGCELGSVPLSYTSDSDTLVFFSRSDAL